MARAITIFSGQWADLPFEEACRKFQSFGYEGVEIACWGDHMNVREAACNASYVAEKKAVLQKYNLKCFALGAHLSGQCVGDPWDERLDSFAPRELAGKPDAIRKWAIEEMILTAKAAAAMGCSVVSGFMGSPVWKYLYSFPPTTGKMIKDGFALIKKLWTPIFNEFDKNKIRFALEVHPGEIAFDYYTTKKLFEIFEHRKTLGLNFDPSHLLWQGMKPELFIKDFPGKIYHVHIKDVSVTLDGRSGLLGSHIEFGDLRRGWNFRSPGHGDVDFEMLIRELNAAGYPGPLSVEWEDNGMDREFGARDALEFVKKINFAPSTIAFDSAMEQ